MLESLSDLSVVLPKHLVEQVKLFTELEIVLKLIVAILPKQRQRLVHLRHCIDLSHVLERDFADSALNVPLLSRRPHFRVGVSRQVNDFKPIQVHGQNRRVKLRLLDVDNSLPSLFKLRFFFSFCAKILTAVASFQGRAVSRSKKRCAL